MNVEQIKMLWSQSKGAKFVSCPHIYIYIYIVLMTPILAYAVSLDKQSDFKILLKKMRN